MEPRLLPRRVYLIRRGTVPIGIAEDLDEAHRLAAESGGEAVPVMTYSDENVLTESERVRLDALEEALQLLHVCRAPGGASEVCWSCQVESRVQARLVLDGLQRQPALPETTP